MSSGQVLPASKSGGILDEVEAFFEVQRAKKIAESTIRFGYGHPLRKILVPFCDARGITRSADLTQELLEELARELHGRKLATASVRSYLKGIRTFLNWAKSSGGRPPLPHLRKKERDVMSLREMRKLEAMNAAVRDQLIVRILADTGMRLSELVSLRVDDVLLKEGKQFLRVAGKTGSRMPSISPEVYERLRRHIARERPRDSAGDQIFVSLSRNSRTRMHEPLTKSGVYQIVKRAAWRMEWRGPVFPHLLRHSNITLRMVRKQSMAEISAETGASIAVLMGYAHPAAADRHASTMKILRDQDQDD